jgi:predicted nucleic acid-binding protein
MVVIDASAVAEIVLDRPVAARIGRHLAEYALHAPHLVDLEVLNALRRLVSAGDVTEERATAAASDLLTLPIARYPHAILGHRIWELRHNFTAYDAAYVALAEMLTDDGVPLLTTDARFARAARKHTDVEVLLAA